MAINQQATDAVNHLIIIAGDGEQGYAEAADYAEDPVLKASFLRYAAERKEFAAELKHLVITTGTEPESGGGPLGALHRVWIDVKTSLAPRNDAAVINDCITGDEAAVSAYQTALQSRDVPEEWRQTLQRQLKLTADALADLREQARQLNN